MHKNMQTIVKNFSVGQETRHIILLYVSECLYKLQIGKWSNAIMNQGK